MPVTVSPTQVQLQLPSGNASLTVHLHGATLTSWKVKEKGEILFVSQKAKLDDPQKAIRGGIPLVFPQFGIGPQSPKVQHGFARLSTWEWMGLEKESNDELVAAFRLAASDQTRGKWPHEFQLVYRLHLQANQLKTELIVKNVDKAESFRFTALLHTYFAVDQLDTLKVHGLRGLSYRDKLLNEAVQNETHDHICINSEVDRTYLNVSGPVKIEQRGRSDLQVQLTGGFRDVVVWNPWIEKAKSMSDFDDQEVSY